MILLNVKNGKKIRVYAKNDNALLADGRMYVHNCKLWVIRKGQYPVTFPITYIGIVPFVFGVYVEDFWDIRHEHYMKAITNNLPF